MPVITTHQNLTNPAAGITTAVIYSQAIPAMPGLLSWITFDSSNVTLDGSGNIEQANDLSGNGNHLVQTNSAERPEHVTDAFNGRAVARFDGTNWLEWVNSVFPDSGDYTIAVIVKNAATTTANQGIVGESSGEDHLIFSTSNGTIQHKIGNDPTITAGYTYDAASQVSLLIGTFDSSTSTGGMVVNDEAFYEETVSGAATDSTTLTLGAGNSSGALPWEGDAAALLVFSENYADAAYSDYLAILRKYVKGFQS